MTQRTHHVARYHYAVDLTQGGLGRLELWDGQGRKVADVGCMDEGRALPHPRIAPDLSTAGLFVHPEALKRLLDVLRHGGSVFMRLDDAPPGYVSFETSGDLAATTQQQSTEHMP